jgi:drug/metabolite transporter (DMT)-like permease
MSQRLSPRIISWIALVGVWFLWGSTYIGIRAAVATIPPFLMAGVRYVIAGAILAAAIGVWNRSAWSELRAPQWRSLLVTAASLIVVGNGLLCYAETRVPAGVAALVVATVPVWMVVVNAIATRTRVAVAAWVGLALGMTGIVLLVGLPGGHIPVAQTLLIVVGACSWAIGSVYGRLNASIRKNPLIPALEMLSAGVMLCMVAGATGEFAQVNLHAISASSQLGFWWLVGPGAIVGYTAYGYAVRTLPTHIVATYAYVNPIVAVALGALLLNEPLTPGVLGGGAVIVLAVVAILRSGTQKRGESASFTRQTTPVRDS